MKPYIEGNRYDVWVYNASGRVVAELTTSNLFRKFERICYIRIRIEEHEPVIEIIWRDNIETTEGPSPEDLAKLPLLKAIVCQQYIPRMIAAYQRGKREGKHSWQYPRIEASTEQDHDHHTSA